jgi:excisionase family DNA binding protein
MQLSLQEAVQILGKTRRQVLYMIEQGRLPARKVGGRWVIERADVQVDEAVQQRTTQKQARLAPGSASGAGIFTSMRSII